MLNGPSNNQILSRIQLLISKQEKLGLNTIELNILKQEIEVLYTRAIIDYEPISIQTGAVEVPTQDIEPVNEQIIESKPSSIDNQEIEDEIIDVEESVLEEIESTEIEDHKETYQEDARKEAQN